MPLKNQQTVAHHVQRKYPDRNEIIHNWHNATDSLRPHFDFDEKMDVLNKAIKALGIEREIENNKDYATLQKQHIIEKILFEIKECDFLSFTPPSVREKKFIAIYILHRQSFLLQKLVEQKALDYETHSAFLNIMGPSNKHANNMTAFNFTNYLSSLVYGFKLSPWHPQDGAKALKREIEEKGMLCFNIRGIENEKTEPSCYAIVVTDIENSKGEKQEVVHFSADSERKNSFALPYEQFSRMLVPQTTKEHAEENYSAPRFFALHAKEAHLKHRETKQHYQNVLNTIFAKVADITFWHNKVSRASSWGENSCVYMKDATGKINKITLPKGIHKIISEVKSYLEDEKQYGNEEKILENIIATANYKLAHPSRLRDQTTTLFYHSIAQLDKRNAKETLKTILNEKNVMALRSIRLN
jgi:hypothetical protein